MLAHICREFRVGVLFISVLTCMSLALAQTKQDLEIGKVASISTKTKEIYLFIIKDEPAIQLGQTLFLVHRGDPIVIENEIIGYQEDLIAKVEVVRIQNKQLVITKAVFVTEGMTPQSNQLVYSSFGDLSYGGEQVGPKTFTLVGDARAFKDYVRLAPAERWKMGAAWTPTKVDIAKGFRADFSFQVTERGGLAGGGDGFAFLIQNVSEDALYQGDPPGQAYYEITNSLAIEFDTYNQENNEPDALHVSIQTNGIKQNSVNHDYSIGCTTRVPVFTDGKVHQVCVEYLPNHITVYLDDLTKPILEQQVNLNQLLALDQGKAWVGFMAGHGNAYEAVDILKWSTDKLTKAPDLIPSEDKGK